MEYFFQLSYDYLRKFHNGSALIAVQSSSVLIVGIVMLTTILLMQVLNTKLTQRMPPGPWGFPYFGNVHQLGTKPHLAFTKMWKKYGDVFRIQLPNNPTVVLCGRAAVKEALLKQSSIFADRPHFKTWQLIADGCSLTSGHYSEKWKLQRKLTFHALLSINSHPDKPVETMVQQHAKALIKELHKSEGLVDPAPILKCCVSNIVFELLFGASDSTDDIREGVLCKLDEFFQIFPQLQIHDMMPTMGKIFLPGALRKAESITKDISDMFKAKMQLHKENYDGVIRNTADAYIAICEQLPEEGHPNGLTKQQILCSLEDLVGAGNLTMLGVLLHSIRYMALHPDVQRKVHEELDSVLDGAIPTWDHKCHLPYTNATLEEIFRHGSVVPLGMPYSTMGDTNLFGYFIPKDTLVFANMHSVNRDPSFWQDPDKFSPERFLTEKGCINKQLQDQNFGVFGLGKRKCIGQALATKIIFILFSSIMQQAGFGENQQWPIKMDEKLDLILCPVPFQVDLKARMI